MRSEQQDAISLRVISWVWKGRMFKKVLQAINELMRAFSTRTLSPWAGLKACRQRNILQAVSAFVQETFKARSQQPVACSDVLRNAI
jgi:hypothetical protein